MGTVYLLHFNEPFKHCRHYIGYTEDLQARLERHKAGNGSRLMAAVGKAGIGFTVAKVWEGVDRNFERQLKNKKSAPRFCPVCAKERMEG